MDSGAGTVAATALRRPLLAWWHQHGRHTIPWKLAVDGRPAADGAPLDPFPIWCAEVMRAARQHSCSRPVGPEASPGALASGLCGDNDARWQVQMADPPGKATVIEGGDRFAIAAAGVMESIGEVKPSAQAIQGLLKAGTILGR